MVLVAPLRCKLLPVHQNATTDFRGARCPPAAAKTASKPGDGQRRSQPSVIWLSRPGEFQAELCSHFTCLPTSPRTSFEGSLQWDERRWPFFDFRTSLRLLYDDTETFHPSGVTILDRSIIHRRLSRRRAPPPALECPGECSATAQVVQSRSGNGGPRSARLTPKHRRRAPWTLRLPHTTRVPAPPPQKLAN